MNFLEELAAEWYAFNGYFTRTNIKFGKRELGGWTGEIDVLAYKPSTAELVHIEISGSAESLTKHKARFLSKKFIVGRKIYTEIAGGEIKVLRKVAIGGWARNPKDVGNDWGDVEPMGVPQFIEGITEALGKINPLKRAIPEQYGKKGVTS